MKAFCCFAFLFFLFSCKKDKCPCISFEQKKRKVLIEEYTGHYDGHGAIAMRDFLAIQNKHKDKVIAVAVHSGLFAKPYLPDYPDDFTCTEGDEYASFFKITFNPAGTVNRMGYPKTIFKTSYQWAGLADSLLLLPAAAGLEIINQYNPSTRTLHSSVQCTFLTPLKGTYKLVVLLTEDSVIAPQRDYSQNPYLVPDYAHRYMLRDGITGSWGDTLFTGEAPLSGTITKHYTYTLPLHFKGRAPNENSCRVVAYVYDASNYEIIQVEEKRIK